MGHKIVMIKANTKPKYYHASSNTIAYMMRIGPKGSEVWMYGSYYKRVNNLVFRWDGFEWVKSSKSSKDIVKELKWRPSKYHTTNYKRKRKC